MLAMGRGRAGNKPGSQNFAIDKSKESICGTELTSLTGWYLSWRDRSPVSNIPIESLFAGSQCVVHHGNQRMTGTKEMHGTGGCVGGPEGCGGALIIVVDGCRAKPW